MLLSVKGEFYKCYIIFVITCKAKDHDTIYSKDSINSFINSVAILNKYVYKSIYNLNIFKKCKILL